MTISGSYSIRTLICVTLLLTISPLMHSQADTISLSLTDSTLHLANLFDSDTPLNCVLKFDIKKFQKEKRFEKYQPVDFYLLVNNKTIIKKKSRIKARGIFRKEHCSLPPYWLNLRRVKEKYNQRNINDKYKVVCHCNYNSNYEDYILKEYLAYKIYNILTDYSFRVRLVKFTYVDTGRKNKTYQRWGFIIEPTNQMAKRLNGVQLKLNTIGMYHTDREITDLVSMNAYMMGNTDWSIAGRHNIKLVKLMDESKPALIPIPYDFDYTGFVNTEYARPAEGSGISTVRQRVYVGPCREITDYQITTQHMQLKKKEILELIDDFEPLKKHIRTDIRIFIEDYFNFVERTNFFKYHIDIDCREKKSLSDN